MAEIKPLQKIYKQPHLSRYVHPAPQTLLSDVQAAPVHLLIGLYVCLPALFDETGKFFLALQPVR